MKEMHPSLTPELLPGIEMGEVFATRKCPELGRIGHRWCAACDAAHQQEARRFSHSHHLPGMICWAHAACDLPVEHQLGICLHEYGHILAGECGTEFDNEKGADLAVLKKMGVEIQYISPHELQWVDLEAIR